MAGIHKGTTYTKLEPATTNGPAHRWQYLLHVGAGALLPIFELVISLGFVGGLMASFISTLYFDASQDMSYMRSTLNAIAGYGVLKL